MAVKSIACVPFFLVLAISLAGCGGNKPATLADFQGDWKSSEGDSPDLSLDAKGKGVLSISFSDADGGHGGLSMSPVEVKPQDGKFFIDTSIRGEMGDSQKYRLELLLSDSTTMKLRLVDPNDKREFTLKKK